MTQRFGNDPKAPGGLDWEIGMAKRRVEFLANIGWPEDDPETQQAKRRLAELEAS